MKTRREFMSGAAMMAAGAAVGFGGGKVHGPVDLYFEFFGPTKLKTILSSDEKTDSFEIKVLTTGVQNILVNFKLSDIRRAAARQVCVQLEVSNENGTTDQMAAYVRPEAGNMVFVTAVNGESESKFWIDLEDVKRVL